MKTFSLLVSILLSIILLGSFVSAQEFPIFEGPDMDTTPDAIFDGTAYTVVYASAGDIWGAKVSTDGSQIETFPIEIDPEYDDSSPAIAFDGSRCCVVWHRMSAICPIQGAIIDGTTVTRRFDVLVNSWPNRPAIAFNGTHYLIVTKIVIIGVSGGVLYGIYYDTNGNLVYPQFTIDWSSNETYFGPAMISSDGEKFIVVYTTTSIGIYNGYSVKYCVVEAPGISQCFTLKSVSTVDNIPGEFDLYPPSVAFNGTNYLCAYHFFEEEVAPFSGILNVYGALIKPDGTIINNDIGIACNMGINEYASAVTAEEENFFVTWQDNRAVDLDHNLYGLHLGPDGSVIYEVIVSEAQGDQTIPKVTFDGINNFVVWQDFRNGRDWDIWGNILPTPLSVFRTDDPFALAYNGNRHLVRKPNSQELHLVYTSRGKIVYRYSSNEGDDWTVPVFIGKGKFPAIALGSDGLPSLVWTDDIGGLWFAKQNMMSDWDVHHLYDPWCFWMARLNAPPSMVITSSDEGDRVHILATLLTIGNGPVAGVAEYDFPLNDLTQREFDYIEGGLTPHHIFCSSPSITKDFNNMLHAVWQREGNAICYAKKATGPGGLQEGWSNPECPFGPQGLQSDHPFVESYGDQMYVVWEHQQPPMMVEEVYIGVRQLPSGSWSWERVTDTLGTPSLVPVCANGRFTVFADLPVTPPPDNWFEIYAIDLEDGIYNISLSPGINSFYPHSVAKYSIDVDACHLYTAWLEGNEEPYDIRFKRSVIPISNFTAYLTSDNGHEDPSPYVVQRDSFISEWSIPVDVGYETITYQFPLEPGYRYKLKATVYHESKGKWREWIKIENRRKRLIKYDAHEPKTLEFWIPPALYRDGMIDIVFERIKGDFATAGPIYIYQFEYAR